MRRIRKPPRIQLATGISADQPLRDNRDKQMKLFTPKIGMIAAAVVAALIVAVVVPANVGTEHEASASAFHAQASFASSEAPATENADPGLLSDEEFAALTEANVQTILAENAAAVAADQTAYAAESSPEDYAKAVEAFDSFKAGMDATIKTEGIDSVREKLKTIAEGDTAGGSASGLDIVTVGSRCITIYKWELQTIAWILMGYGTLVAIGGAFVSGTIIGLPAGAVMVATGTTLTFTASLFLWKVDQIRWSSKRACW